ncbi:MAG: hypothetical protein HRU04_23750 [Oceanospirillaceae bacterium]|nr:hypothetical protein [Oceanospirillaceae bacterium]
MNILFVLRDFPVGGGVEIVSLNLAYQFKKEGHEISFFIMDGMTVPVDIYKDFKIYSGNSLGLIGIYKSLLSIIKWIKQGQYSVVIAAKEQANILTYLASLFYAKFTPIYTRHCSFDVSDQKLSAT